MDAHSVPARADSPTGSRIQTLIIVAIPLALGVAAYFGSISRLPITGDEPHYLVMAESIATDFDLDLRNNYEDGRRLRFLLLVAPRWRTEPIKRNAGRRREPPRRRHCLSRLGRPRSSR